MNPLALCLFALVAHAQTLDPEIAGEVVVEGGLAVRATRSALVAQIRAEGWTLKRRDGEVMVFTPPQPWMGKARLHPDGHIDFSRPVIVPQEADLSPTTGYGDFGATDRDAPLVALVGEEAVASGSAEAGSEGRPYPVITPRLGLVVLPRRSLLDSVRADLLRQVAPQRERYLAALQAHNEEDLLATLPDRLDALWSHGQPLLGSTPIASTQERKLEALRYWAALPDTVTGRAVAEALNTWLLAVVQTSDSPISDDERVRAEAARGDGWTLLHPQESP